MRTAILCVLEVDSVAFVVAIAVRAGSTSRWIPTVERHS